MTPLTEVQNSGVIAAHGYDAATQTLAVRFKSGSVFHYADVPMDVAAAFINAESLGKAYGSMIRGKFKHELAHADPVDDDGSSSVD